MFRILSRFSLKRSFSTTASENLAISEVEKIANLSVPSNSLIKVDAFGRAYGTGRRKTSIARVWIKEGSGQFVVNHRDFVEYFQPMQREHCLGPFIQSKTAGLFDVTCLVKGGGISGQAGAVRLGLSKALVNFMPLVKTSLRQAGMMTRDPRSVERKKPGQHKARKQYQWVKR